MKAKKRVGIDEILDNSKGSNNSGKIPVEKSNEPENSHMPNFNHEASQTNCRGCHYE